MYPAVAIQCVPDPSTASQAKPGWCETSARVKCQVLSDSEYHPATQRAYVSAVYLHTYEGRTSWIWSSYIYLTDLSQAATLLTRCVSDSHNAIKEEIYLIHAGTQKDQMIRVFLLFLPSNRWLAAELVRTGVWF